MATSDASIFNQYQLKSEAERYLWAGWTMFVVVSSLLGDTAILLASVKYKAFKLHKFTITFIQHIAVSDLILALTYVVPSFASLVADGWAFGNILCYLQPYPVWLCCQGSMFLICGMTTTKIMQLKYPLRARSWPKRKAQKICVGIWLLALYYPICFLVVDPDDAAFDYRVYFCNPVFSSPKWKLLLPISFFAIGVIPNLIIITTTIFLLYKAKKSLSKHEGKGKNEGRGKLKWQGIMTVVLTASAYILSYLPVTIYFIAASYVKMNPGDLGWFHLDYHRIAVSLTHTNIMANFFVYSLTVDSFRTFLRQTLSGQTYHPLKYQGDCIVLSGEVCTLKKEKLTVINITSSLLFFRFLIFNFQDLKLFF